jgi:hypothetical protein
MNEELENPKIYKNVNDYLKIMRREYLIKRESFEIISKWLIKKFKENYPKLLSK